MSEWIDVKDRMPDEYVRVLTYNHYIDEQMVDYLVFFVHSQGVDKLWAHKMGCNGQRVTHWMPLPAPPVPKEK